MKQTLRIALFAGESSGDQLGACLLRDLRLRVDGPVEAWGGGGPALIQAGMEAVVGRPAAVMGFWRVLRHGWMFWQIYRQMAEQLRIRRPDVFVAIDYAGMNLRLAMVAKKLGIPVFFYVSPQVWAWRSHRLRTMNRCIDTLAVLYPFEVRFYASKQVAFQVVYVGHPLANQPSTPVSHASDTMLLLPGSRKQEVDACWQDMARAAHLYQQSHPSTQWVCVVADALGPLHRVQQTWGQALAGLPVRWLEQKALPSALSEARACVCVSGTITLHALMARLPMVVVYRTSRLLGWVLTHVLDSQFVALPNLLAGRRVVPELLQDQCSPERIVAALTQAEEQRPGLEEARGVLTEPPCMNACQALLRLVGLG